MDQNETKNYRICIYPSLIEKKLLDQWNNLRQETKSINKYITQFNDYMMRCAIRENEPMTLRRFYKGLNDDFRKKVKLTSAFTLDQAYTVVQDYELLKKSQWTKHQNPFKTSFRFQFRNNGSLLSASPCRPNPSSA